MEREIIVYTTEPCSFCVRAKQLLTKRGLTFSEVNLSKDPAGRAELAERTGMFSFPQVVVDGEILGGWREVLEADEAGKLEELAA